MIDVDKMIEGFGRSVMIENFDKAILKLAEDDELLSELEARRYEEDELAW